MSNLPFVFAPDRRHFLGSLLARIKPHLDREKIWFFLAECEKAISEWLAEWPADGWRPDKQKAPWELEKIAHHANALANLLQYGDQHVIFRLMVCLINDCEFGKECSTQRGVGQSEAREWNDGLVADLRLLHQEALEMKTGTGEPLRKKPARYLAIRLSEAYASVFGKVPSLNPGGIYREFLTEISANDLPKGFRVTISREDQRLANARAQVFTNDYL